MNWTEPNKPTKGVSHYDHVMCETPLGKCLIEWKSWKENDDFSVEIGNEWIGSGYNLEDAKELAKKYLSKKREELDLFLSL